LVLTRYAQKGASSRVRLFAFQKQLEKDQWQPHFQSLLPDSYLESLYAKGRRPRLTTLWAYLRRFCFLIFSAHKFPVVWIEKELFPGAPTWLERWFLRRMSKVVLDYDDAVHLNYHNSGWGRQKKIESLIPMADVVFAGSPALEAMAQQAGAQKVVRVPTAVDVPEYRRPPQAPPLKIGWVGSPATEKYLRPIKPFLEALDPSLYEVHLMGVPSSRWSDKSVFKIWDWSPENQQAFLNEIQWGLMPLEDEPWERCKCAYKILLYGAHGVPALASPVGMNTEVIESGVNGYLISGDWQQALLGLPQPDSTAYQELSAKAFAIVKSAYSYPAVYAIIRQNLQSLRETL
jgi:glycosyltransferase involved in cell wall biosynthesis